MRPERLRSWFPPATRIVDRKQQRAGRASGAAAQAETAGEAISTARILALWHLKFNLPLQDARACGSGLSFRDVAGALQRDGQRGVSERITGSESRKSQGRGDR